jgi:hypothetical protein
MYGQFMKKIKYQNECLRSKSGNILEVPKMTKMTAILERGKQIKCFYGCQTNHLDIRKTDSIVINTFNKIKPIKIRYTTSDQKILKILCIFNENNFIWRALGVYIEGRQAEKIQN